jgi:hypothetical protein
MPCVVGGVLPIAFRLEAAIGLAALLMAAYDPKQN